MLLRTFAFLPSLSIWISQTLSSWRAMTRELGSSTITFQVPACGPSAARALIARTARDRAARASQGRRMRLSLWGEGPLGNGGLHCSPPQDGCGEEIHSIALDAERPCRTS